MKVRDIYAEAFGSAVFVFSIFLSKGNPLVVGGTLALMIYILAASSGAHFNPAVSFTQALDSTIGWGKFAYYLIAQLIGASAGYGLYRAALKWA